MEMACIDNCTGCRACEQRCMGEGIAVRQNEEGFYTAFGEQARCIRCNVCVGICPQRNEYVQRGLEEIYAAKAISDEKRMRSASGSAFTALAERVIDEGGFVFGAAYTEGMKVEIICVHSWEGLQMLQGAKYVQSDTSSSYRECRSLLEQGKKVLYSGLPCQIAGLKAFLGREFDKLITVDLVCHGVPSPRLHEKYINNLGAKMRGRIMGYNSRDKQTRGGGFGISVSTQTTTKRINCFFDPYYMAYIDEKVFMEACYECKYARRERVSDITLGDFRGASSLYKNLYDKKGVSMIMLNTQKGKALFEKAKKFMEIEPSDFERAAQFNESLIHCAHRPPERNTVYAQINVLSDEEFIKSLGYKVGVKELIRAYTPFKPEKKFIRGK